MKTLTTKCIILGHKNFGEYHKLIFCYAEGLGKIKAVAKGARKITSKFTGHLETLNICTASFYFGPRSTILTEIVSTENSPKIIPKLESFCSLLQIAETTDKLIYENQTYEGLTQLLEETLNYFNKSSKKFLITITYLIKFLDKIGIIPNFKETEINLPTKYSKFFQFINKSTFPEILKIKLTTKEKEETRNYLKNLIEQETQSCLLTFNTPGTFSSLSKSKLNLSNSPISKTK